MSGYAESAATPAATLTKLITGGRRSSARQATHNEVGGTSRAGMNTMSGRALNASEDAGHRLMPRPAAMCSRQHLLRHVGALRGGGEARLLGDRDEVPEMPHFYVHRGPNPNHRADPPNGDKLGPGSQTL